MPVIFLVSFQGMEKGRHQQAGEMLGNTKLWEDTAKMIWGAVEPRGLNVLMKVKAETTGKYACFSVLQVHEDPR